MIQIVNAPEVFVVKILLQHPKPVFVKLNVIAVLLPIV